MDQRCLSVFAWIRGEPMCDVGEEMRLGAVEATWIRNYSFV
jgi:hypothetical protein